MVGIEKLRVGGVVEEREEQRDRAFCHRGLESSSALPIGLLSVDREKKNLRVFTHKIIEIVLVSILHL